MPCTVTMLCSCEKVFFRIVTDNTKRIFGAENPIVSIKCFWVGVNRSNGMEKFQGVVHNMAATMLKHYPYIVATKTILMSKQNTMLMLLVLLLLFAKWSQKAKNYQENINQSLSLLSSTKYSPTLHLIAFDFIVKTENSLGQIVHISCGPITVWNIYVCVCVPKKHSQNTTIVKPKAIFSTYCTSIFIEHLIAGPNFSWFHVDFTQECARGKESVCVHLLVCTINCHSRKPFEL